MFIEPQVSQSQWVSDALVVDEQFSQCNTTASLGFLTGITH